MPPSRPTSLLAAGLSAVAVAFAGAALPAPAAAQDIAPKPAASTRAFADSVGVNVHIGYTNTSYGNFPQVKAKLQGLGARWIRDGLCATCVTQQSRLNELAGAGIRSQLQIGTPRDLSTVDAGVSAAERLPRGVGAFEGVNEWDLHGGSTWKETLKQHQTRLYQRVKSSATLSQVPVLGPSIVRSANREALGDISNILDYGNIHPYAGGLKPGWNIPAELASGALNSGTKPIVAGEIGYHNAVGTTTTHPGVSEKAAGIYVPRMYLDAFSRGVKRSFAYELVNLHGDSTATKRDYNFGLLRADFTEKPAYTHLKTLMHLLGDTTAEGTPGGLRYEIAGDTTDVRSLLLQGADGAFYLSLWQDASVWDRDLKRDLTVAPRDVRLSFGQTIDRAQVFDVLRGTTAVATHTSPRHLDMQVPAQPIVIKLTPGTAPFVAESTGTGLQGTYFDNADLTAPKVTRIDPWIAMNWGTARPVPEVHYDTFSVRWTGSIMPRYTETYTLHLTTDDGARLWVDGRLLLDKWGKQAGIENTVQVPLTAGRHHDIKLEYFDNMYGASAKLEWSSARQARQIVPASALYPSAG